MTEDRIRKRPTCPPNWRSAPGGPASVSDRAQQRTRPVAEFLVDGDIVFRHPARGEAALELPAHQPPVELVEAADRADRRLLVRHDEPGHVVYGHLGHR